MIRRFGDTPRKDISYKLRPGAYAILMREGRILLTFQKSPYPEFQLPGGGIDVGEHMIPALHREVMEETGWTIGTPLRLGAHRRFVHMPEYGIWAEKMCHIFLARPVLKKGLPTEAGHQSHWASPQDAINVIRNPADKLFLTKVIRAFT